MYPLPARVIEHNRKGVGSTIVEELVGNFLEVIFVQLFNVTLWIVIRNGY